MATATLAIDLDAIAANWRALDRLSGQGVQTGAVVKADAYGLGAARVSRALAQAGARRFFVAAAEEGAAVRQALGPGPQINVLSGHMAGDTEMIGDLDLTPMLNSLEQITRHLEALPGHPFGVQLDTGMNRLGLSVDEAQAALAALGRPPELVMSHFVSSEDQASPDNAAQIERFARVRAMIPNVRATICNSSGIYLSAHPWLDIARPGYALYGGNPTPGGANPMRPVVRLEAPILQTRRIEAGAHVGYNAQWTARRATLLAAIPVGYADGIPRSAMGVDGKPGPDVAIAGVRCPIVGRVSMDLITVDATGAPAGAVERRALVEVLGPTIGIDEFGERAGTIGYEILTSLGRRYRRVYVG